MPGLCRVFLKPAASACDATNAGPLQTLGFLQGAPSRTPPGCFRVMRIQPGSATPPEGETAVPPPRQRPASLAISGLPRRRPRWSRNAKKVPVRGVAVKNGANRMARMPSASLSPRGRGLG